MMMLARRLFFAGLLLAACSVQALDIVAAGLFKNAAVLVINGQQHMLKAGQRSPEGILLVSANTREAVVEIDGQRRTLTLDQRISGQYAARERTEVSINRNSYNQYITTAMINNQSIEVLVDTGANIIAMSKNHAKSLGIDYKRGQPARVRTASGVSPAFALSLRSVNVGGIEVHNVRAMVTDGPFPEKILLGMTYLEHVEMREENGVMLLKAKY